MTTLSFSMRTLSPALTSTGHPLDGFDVVTDVDEPLDGRTLKGLIKATCRTHLGVPDAQIDEIFGTTTATSMWSFDVGPPANSMAVHTARVQIGEGGTAVKDMLVLARAVDFDGLRLDLSPSPLLLDSQRSKQLQRHAIILTAATLSLRSIGSQRRRGVGWVEVTPVAADDLALVCGLDAGDGSLWAGLAQAITRMRDEGSVVSG